AWITSIDESSDWLSANDPCVLDLGNGWRLPTKSEWAFIDNAEGWVNYNDTYDSVLKLHAAGNLNYSVGSLNSRGIYGYYWSSTQFSSTNGRYFILNSGSAYTNSSFKTNGFAVRCLRDY
ncbi:MAG: hypothetical protein JKX79_06965, partial [Labilibaculum sp.]|nr:hypothetical protein [Labilibaculum sp.]